METITITPLREAAEAAARAKEAKIAADSAWRTVEADTLAVFAANETKTFVITEDDGTFTRVTAEGLEEVTRSVDVDAALSLLTDEQIKAVASLAISLSSIDAAIKTGVIPAALADKFITTKKTKPSLRITFGAKNAEVK